MGLIEILKFRAQLGPDGAKFFDTVDRLSRMMDFLSEASDKEKAIAQLIEDAQVQYKIIHSHKKEWKELSGEDPDKTLADLYKLELSLEDELQ